MADAEIAREIFELAESIANGSDVIGIENWRLIELVRAVIEADRKMRHDK